MPNANPNPTPPKPKKKGSVTSGAFKPRTPTASGHGGNPVPRPPHQREGDDYRPHNSPELAQARRTAYDALPPGYHDIAGDGSISPFELWLRGQNGDSNFNGGGGGRSSSANPAVSQETINAYQQMLAAIDAQGSSENQTFDQRGNSLTQLQGAGDQRLQDMLARLAQARMANQSATAASFGNTDAELQQLAQQYGQQSQARNDGVNRSLAAFGVGPEQGQGQGIQDLLMASREQNARLGGAADVSYVNRGNVANALGADAQAQYGQQYSQLQAQLQAQRQAAAIVQAQRRAALAMQAAAAGVTLPQPTPPPANGGLPFSG